jgi:aquaporin Z
VNPARSIGPAVFVGFPALSQRWLFIMAPLVGAVLAFGDLRVLVSEPRFSSADRRVVQ